MKKNSHKGVNFKKLYEKTYTMTNCLKKGNCRNQKRSHQASFVLSSLFIPLDMNPDFQQSGFLHPDFQRSTIQQLKKRGIVKMVENFFLNSGTENFMSALMIISCTFTADRWEWYRNLKSSDTSLLQPVHMCARVGLPLWYYFKCFKLILNYLVVLSIVLTLTMPE